MKKNNLVLVLASSFLLASCGPEKPIEESSLIQSEASSLTSESEASSAPEAVAIKGDTSRTYLNNALETSFTKKGFTAEVSSFKLDATSREYTIGTPVEEGSTEYQLVKTNNTEGYSVSSPKVVLASVGRDKTSFDKYGMYFGIKDATYKTTENGVQSEIEEHQYANLYLKDNKFYYNFINDQGVETPGMSEIVEEIIDGAGTKGYIDLADLEITETLDALMPTTQFSEYLPTIADLLLDGLTDVNGVEFTYEGAKIDGEKYYTTTIHITDAKAIYTAAHNIIENLPDMIDEILGDDLSIEDLLEVLEEVEDDFDFAKKFDLSVALKYTPTFIKSIDYSFECENKDTGHTTTLDPEFDEVTGSETLLDKISLSGSAAFAFSDNFAITYPDFTDYQKIEIETEEPEDDPIEIE